MKKLSLTLLFCMSLILGYSQTDYSFDPGYRIPDNTTHYYKFAVLPASTGGTGEMLTVKLTGGSFLSNGKKIENMYFSNRGGFKGIITEKYGDIWDNLRIEAYSETDGSVSLYFVMDNSYSHGEIFASTSGISSGNVLKSNPTKITTVTSGSLIFSSIEQDGNIRALSSGNIGIGTDLSSNPNNYKFAVNGTIGAKEVKVEINSSTWSDFVFNDDYNLKSIKEIETFIKTNRHLPDIPTANEVENNGVNLGEMDAKLLQKIEELTLYIIEQNKKIEDLQSQINELKN